MAIPSCLRVGIFVTIMVLCARGQGPAEDEVRHLPGLSVQPTFKQYSGFLYAGGNRRLHYWYMESQRHPETDPLLLWLNGGPGASSLIGAMAENGPFRVGKKGKGLLINPHSWNTVANVLYLEAPAGVGFSYDPSGVYDTNDDKTADDNYLAIQAFFRKFPTLRKKEFYITGESYGGVYVPMLTQRLLKAPKGINLRGFVVGNGALDETALDNSLVFFGYHHGFFDLDTWTRLIQHCCNGSASPQGCNFLDPKTETVALCKEEVEKVYEKMASLPLNHYNIYDECRMDNMLLETTARIMSRTSPYHRHLYAAVRNRSYSKQLASDCIDLNDVAAYMNRPDVKAALHVESSPLNWTSSSYILQYHRQYYDMTPAVKELVDSGRLRSLIYNGDVDMVCNFIGDQWFVNNLGYKNTTEYKEWFHKKQLAGFYQSFAGNLTYATIRGSGHMVPHDKPAQALHMISRFMANKPL